MKYLHLIGITAVMSAALIFAAREAGAQTPGPGGVARNNFPSVNHFSWEGGHDGFRGGLHNGSHRGFHHGFGGGVWVVESEPVVIEREVIREVPVAMPAPEPAPAPREPYVLGKSYASLPGGCMKMIEDGTSFFYCGGDWYRQIGDGRSAMYKAVDRQL